MAVNPLVIPEGFGKAAITFTCVGTTREASVTFGFTDDPASDANDLAAEIVLDWIGSFPLNSLATSWSVNGCDLTVTRGGLPVVGNNVNVQAGTAAFDPETLAVAALIRKNTALGGRQGRGRMFLPAGYVGATITSPNGAIDAAVVAATTTRIQAFRTALIADDMDMVLLHHRDIRDPAAPAPAMMPNPLADTPTPVTAVFCEGVVATQRRRQRG